MSPTLRWIASIVGLWAGVAAAQGARPVETVPGMPPVPDPTNLYSETRSDKMSPAVAGALSRIYVPNRQGNDVYVIDPATMKVVDQFKVGINPQHVVPSWDMKTLWVTNNAEGRPDGSLTPIDPTTGKPGKTIMVDDPYNMYFTPDGKSAIVVAEALKRLDFRDPQTMALQYSIAVPGCTGINHADFSIDGRIAIFTCEFQGSLAKIDLVDRKVLGYLKLSRGGMPQDIRSLARRQHLLRRRHEGRRRLRHRRRHLHGDRLHQDRHRHPRALPEPRRHQALRGQPRHEHVHGPPKGKGSVSVLDFATRQIVATWTVPGGGSPDMGNVSIDGKVLWLSGRYDNVVYAIDTTSGEVPQHPRSARSRTASPCGRSPGRYSLGHTGNMR